MDDFFKLGLILLIGIVVGMFSVGFMIVSDCHDNNEIRLFGIDYACVELVK